VLSRPTHHLVDDLLPIFRKVLVPLPWMQIGVFPTTEDDVLYSWFNYTVGLGWAELWASCVSVEGRSAGNDLTGEILNVLAAAWRDGALSFGDQVIVPLGMPNGPDVESIWWVGDRREPAKKRGCNVGSPQWCVPILWTSPLGWRDGE
jgi:hypothetical protein